MRDVKEWTSNAAVAAKLEYQVAAAIAAVTFAASAGPSRTGPAADGADPGRI